MKKLINKIKLNRRLRKLPMEWRRFEDITENEEERSRLEKVLRKSNLTRQGLAIILFGLRVRPEFSKRDFGI